MVDIPKGIETFYAELYELQMPNLRENIPEITIQNFNSDMIKLVGDILLKLIQVLINQRIN